MCRPPIASSEALTPLRKDASMTLTFRSLADQQAPEQSAAPTLSRTEMRVYDLLVAADAPLTMGDLSVSLARTGSCAGLAGAVRSLVADGVCWRDGALVGLVSE